VEEDPAGTEKPLVGGLPNPVVAEREPPARLLEDPPPHQLLHPSGGLLRREVGGPVEQAELELAADDGGHVDQPSGPLAETREPLRDEGLHLAGQGRAAGLERGPLAQVPRDLHCRERVTYAGPPDLLLERA
jgi:hypothetical protein